MSDKPDEIRIHDASVSFWQDAVDQERGRKLLLRICGEMKSRGWKIGVDPYTLKHAKCLSPNTRSGNRKGLEVHASNFGRHLEFQFFQNVQRPPDSNPHGGRYDFNKLRDMPYLLRLRTQYEMRLLVETGTQAGFTYKAVRSPESTMEAVFIERKKLADFHPRIFVDGSCERCGNGIDADGKQLEDGCYRTCYDYHGHIFTGQVWYHINNMWWVVSGGQYLNKAAFELFAYDSSKHPRRFDRYAKKRRAEKLATLVENGDLQGAVRLQAAMKRNGESCGLKVTATA